MASSGLQQNELPWRTVFLAFAAFLVVAVIVVGANPFAGETSAPMALLDQFAGWSSHQFVSAASHPERSDVLDVFLPQWIEIKEALWSGQSGWWNKVSINGSPGLLDVSRSCFTPSFFLFLLIQDHWLAFYFACLVKLVVAGLGSFLFFRLFLTSAASFFGGLCFAYTGFNAAWFYWPQVSTSAWLPWLFWATAGWCLYRTPWWLLGVVATAGLLLLGGFPVVSAYGLYAAALLTGMLLVPRAVNHPYRSAWAGVLYFAAIGTAFLLASIPLLALLEVLEMTNLESRHGGTAFLFPQDLRLLYKASVNGILRVERTAYAGIVATVMAFGSLAPFLFRKFHERERALFFYGTTLFACSVIIGFGVLPLEFIRSVPAVGSHPWSRLAVMVGFSVATLASLSFNVVCSFLFFSKKAYIRNLVGVLLVFCSGYQLYDQSVFFRRFNSIASKHDFFPNTPSLQFVKSNLTATQGVLADHAYFISGVLGAYGISEWFAHGFRTDTEKEVLGRLVDEPFKTPTAAVFNRDAVQLESPFFSKLGIRYLMLDKKRARLRYQPHLKTSVTPPMPQNTIAQSFQIDQALTLSSVGIVLATYGKKQAPADVSLEILGDNNKMYGQAVVSAPIVRDNLTTRFEFGRNILLEPGMYQLHLKLVDPRTEAPLTAWYSGQPHYQEDVLSINGRKTPGALLYSFYGPDFQVSGDNRWQVHEDIEENILVVENLDVPDGAYLVPSLDEQADWSEEGVTTRRTGADNITVSYDGDRGGFLVVPVRWFPGWVAYKDGKKSIPARYLGMLPAVKVNGPGVVEFRYEPEYLKIGSVLMVLGLCCVPVLYRLSARHHTAHLFKKKNS